MKLYKNNMKIFLILLILILVSLCLIFKSTIIFRPPITPLTEKEIVNNCEGLDLKKTSICLVENIKTFYKYRFIYNDSNLSVQELTESGGDCTDYSKLYKRLASDLGYNATTRHYTNIENVKNGHMWTIIWDDTYYCELDLIKKVKCYKINEEYVKNEK